MLRKSLPVKLKLCNNIKKLDFNKQVFKNIYILNDKNANSLHEKNTIYKFVLT